MKNWYKNLETRFPTFPSEVQVLHVVTELNRARNMLKDNAHSAKNNLFRSIILLDFMINDPKWRVKLGELLQLREVIGSLIFYQKPYGTIEQIIQTTLLIEPKAYKMLKDQTTANFTT